MNQRTREREMYNFRQLSAAVGQERALKDWKAKGWLQPCAVTAGGRKLYDLNSVEEAKRTSLIEAENSNKTRSSATSNASAKARLDRILDRYIPTKKASIAR